MNIVVYTSIVGNIDNLLPVRGKATVPHIAFVTQRHKGRAPWEQRIVEAEWGARRTARHYKACPHLYMPDADVWIWIDGNVHLFNPEQAIARWLKNDLATFNHWERHCLYDEAAFCAKIGKDAKALLAAQAARYREAGMPANWGLAATRIVIRRNTAQIRKFNEMWWDEMQHGSLRDQVSLPFVCWTLGMRWGVIPGKLIPGMTTADFACVRHTHGGR